MLDTILDSPLSSWLQLDTDATDHIVISSRIRLARNFDGILFTNRNDMSSLEKVNTISRGLLQPLKEADGHQYSNINLEQLRSVNGPYWLKTFDEPCFRGKTTVPQLSGF